MRLVALAVSGIVLLTGAPQPIVAQARQAIEGGELFRMMTALERIPPTPEQQRQWTGAQRTPFGPFDPSSDGLRSLTLIVIRDPLDCNMMMNMQRANVSVIVEINRGDTIEFWKVRPPEIREDNDPDRCYFDVSENWMLTDNAGRDSVSKRDDLLIFDVAFEADWAATRGGSVSTRNRLVIDARGPVPMLVARLSSYEIDTTCSFAEPRPSTSCRWDDARRDFVCTETHLDGHAQRHSLLFSGTRLATADGRQPRTLDQFKGGIGDWAELDDVGAVRLIAEIPGRAGRTIRLFGAHPGLGTPFVAELRDGGRRMTVPVTLQVAKPEFEPDQIYSVAWPQTIPLTEYHLIDEPPAFRTQVLRRDRNVQLLRVVMEGNSQVRTVYHVAVEDTGAAVIAQAIHLTAEPAMDTPGGEFDINVPIDACENQMSGFVFPARIRVAPLRIDYDVEPQFRTGSLEGPRRPESCVIGAHATWRSGKGFDIAVERAPCSQTRFRLPKIGPDGTITPQVVRVPPQ